MLVLLIWLYNCYTPEWCVPLRVNERGSCFHSLDKLGFVEMTEPAANGLIRHGLRRATFPRGEGYEVPRPWLFPFTPGTHMYKPHRLQRDLKRNDAAILQRIASDLAEIQAILCNRAAPNAAATTPTQENGGGPGGSCVCFPTAALCARVDDPSTHESGSQAAVRSCL